MADEAPTAKSTMQLLRKLLMKFTTKLTTNLHTKDSHEPRFYHCQLRHEIANGQRCSFTRTLLVAMTHVSVVV